MKSVAGMEAFLKSFSIFLCLLQLIVEGGQCDDIPDYEYVDEHMLSELIPNDTIVGKEQEKEVIIQEAVKKARSKILNDPELGSLIKAKIDEFQAVRQKCLENEGNYFDHSVHDCRSCSRNGCQKDATCATECKGFFKLKNLEKDWEERRNSDIQTFNDTIKGIKSKQSAMEAQYKVWLIALSIFVTVAIVLLVLIIILLTTRKKGTERDGSKSIFHPISDLFGEAKKLLKQEGSANGNGDNRAEEHQV